MLRFLQDALSEQSFDLSTGQAERASVGPPTAVVHLYDNVGLGNQLWKETTNVLSCLSRLTLGEEQLQNSSQYGATCFASARDTNLNPVE
jgi:hypothetical protein